MEKEVLKNQLFIHMFELLFEQGLLSAEENERLKVMLNSQNQ